MLKDLENLMITWKHKHGVVGVASREEGATAATEEVAATAAATAGGDGSGGGGGPDEGSFEAFMHQHFPENTRLVDGVVVLDERVQGEEWRGRFERIDASTELHDLGPAPQET